MPGIDLASNFRLNAQLPLDDRFVFNDIASRDALASIQRYDGLLCYVKSDQKFYVLRGGTANTNWTELILDGAITTLKLADGAATPQKTDFLQLDTSVNLWDGIYYNKLISGTTGTQTLSDSTAGRTVIVPVEKNTTYSIIIDAANSNRFRYGLATTLISSGAFDCGDNYYSTAKNAIINSGNANYLFVNTSNESKTPFIQIYKGSITAFTVTKLVYKPKDTISVYNKSETDEKIALATGNGSVTPVKTNFLELDKTVNLWDGVYYNKNISGTSGALTLSESSAGRTVIVPVKPNTTYTFITDAANSNRFYYGFSSARIETGSFDGANSYLSSSRILTINSGNGNWLYLNTSNESKTPFVQVYEGTITGFTVNKLVYAPKDDLSLYRKSEMDTKLTDLKTEIIETTGAARKIKVVKTGESLVIYIPSKRSARYTAWTFARYSRSVKSVDVWRITNISITDASLNVLYILCDLYDVDGVVKIAGEEDYIGGYHGYETQTNMHVLIDGILEDMAQDFTRECQTLRIVVKSIVNNFGTTTKAFDKFKALVFTYDGVDIYSKYIAAINTTIEQGRVCLLTIEKTSNGTSLINKYTENYNFLPIDIPTNGADGATLVYNDLISEIEFFGAEVYAKLSRGKSSEIGQRGSVVDFTTRMKGYLDCVRNYQISPGQYIENNSHYEVYS